MRAIRGREAVMRLRVENELGDLVAATGTPTIAVVDGDGNVVTGVSAVSTPSTGVYAATLPPQTVLDVLSVTWSYTVGGVARTTRDVVVVTGSRVASLYFYRQDTELAAITDAATFGALLDAVDDWFESALGYAPVETPLRYTFDAIGGKSLRVPGAAYPVSALAIADGVTILTQPDLDDLTVVNGAFEFSYAGSQDIIYGCATRQWSPGRKTVWITHAGPPEWNGIVPADLQRAARTLARYTARGSNYPERARMVQTEGAMITFSTPSTDRPTGLPEVDGAITRYRLPTVV
jgi:hypothetical protein